MIRYSWRKAWRTFTQARAAMKDPNNRYLIVDLQTGHTAPRDTLYALRSPGGFAATMHALRHGKADQ